MRIKLAYLDGMRGWAALIVVFGHYCFAWLPYAIDRKGLQHYGFEATLHDTPWYVLVNGSFAVCIFFILSGIVLSMSFFRRRDVAVVQHSAVKRYFRLAIPAGMSVLLAYILLQTGSFHNQAAADISGSGWWSQFWHFDIGLWHMFQYGFYYSLTQPSGPDTLNPVLWTLQVELFGSFLVYTILALFGRLPQRWIVYVIASIWLWKTYYFGFIIGLVMADILTKGWIARLPQLLRQVAWLPLLGAGIILGSMPNGTLDHTIFHMFADWYQPSLDKLKIVILTLGATLLMLAVLLSPLLQKLLVSRPSRFLGHISFSLYLTHFLILGSYSSYFFVSMHLAGWPYPLIILTNLGVGMTITFAVAYLFTRLIDEPAIKLSGWLYRRVFARSKSYALSYKHEINT